MTLRELAGLRVLIVEDESLVAMLIEDDLTDLGCAVAGSAATLAAGLHQAGVLAIDVAVLDVNLNGERTDPIAQLLQSRGIPFIFATGYGSAAKGPGTERVPTLTKPFSKNDLSRALSEALANAERR